MCHIVIWEFFDTYESEEGFVGAFPVYKEAGGKIVGYRPTDNTCLMREMQSKTLCPVCREAIWKNLFSRTRMIQSIQYSHQNNDITLITENITVWHKTEEEKISNAIVSTMKIFMSDGIRRILLDLSSHGAKKHVFPEFKSERIDWKMASIRRINFKRSRKR